MRVCLVNMPIRVHADANNAPLGIYAVGAAIKRSHPEVEVAYCDLNLYRVGNIWRCWRKSLEHMSLQADVYMLSGLITTLAAQREAVKCIREKQPIAKIISGGGLASNIGEELLDWLDVDAIATGEGEGIVSYIVSDISRKKLKRVYVGNPVNLAALPPMPWDDVQGMEQYIQRPIWGGDAKNSSATPFTMRRSLNYVATRGCPFDCAFCNRDVLGGRAYRTPKPGKVVGDVELLKAKFDLDFIGFTDDNFTARRGFFEEFCEQIKPVGIKWGCHARFDGVDDPALLKLAHEAGCVYFGFGGESANRDILAAMNKKNDPDQMARVIGMCRAEMIHPNCTWIMGWPGETRKQLRDTCQFILRHAPENKSLFVATAYPHTRLWDQVKDQVLAQYGSLEKYVLELDDATKPVMNYSAMSAGEFCHVGGLVKAGRLEEV